jgi:hypothetical protein
MPVANNVAQTDMGSHFHTSISMLKLCEKRNKLHKLYNKKIFDDSVGWRLAMYVYGTCS